MMKKKNEEEARVLKWSDLNKIKNILRKKKSVLVGGCFDIFHYGHLVFLKKAKEQGALLVVALESDTFIRKAKKREPVHSQEQRAAVLSALRFVDLVIKLPYFRKNEDYFAMVKSLKPAVIAVTSGDKQLENKKKQSKLIDAKVVLVTEPVAHYSSSKLIPYAPFPSD